MGRRVRFAIFASFVLGSLGMLSARAEIAEIRQDFVSPDRSYRAEVTVILPETEEERRAVVARLAKSLADDRRANPGLKTSFEWVVAEKGRSPNSDSPAGKSFEDLDPSEPVKKRVLASGTRQVLWTRVTKNRARSIDFLTKQHRPMFTIVRGLMNGTIATWGFVESDENDVPFEVALAAGAVTGLMSGSMQWWNDEILAYLQRSFAKSWFTHPGLGKTAAHAESVFRWYVLEVGFIAVIESVLAILGAPTGTTIGRAAGSAAMTVVGQGIWDLGNAAEVDYKLPRAGTERLRSSIRLRSGLISLLVSGASVSMLICRTLNWDAGGWIFGGMAVTGGIYYARVLSKQASCRAKLHPKPPNAPGTSGDPNSPFEARELGI